MLDQRVKWIAAGLAILLPLFWVMRVSDAPIEKDAAQTVQMAVNLKIRGIISDSEAAPYSPTMVREPLPAVVAVALMSIGEWIHGPAQQEADYFSGERARFLKYQNVVWLGLLCAGVYASIVVFSASHWAALIGVLVVNVPLLNMTTNKYMLDSMYTEAPAAAMLIWGSLLLAWGLLRRQWLGWVVAGVVFGLLTLTKAIYLYIFAVLVVLLVLSTPLRWNSDSMWTRLARVVVLALGFAVIVLPWMVRNQQSLGVFAVSYRGGEVMHIRALKDRMTPTEIRGAIYFWAPYPLNGALRRLFGFEKSDVDKGGSLQRLNRHPGSKFAEADMAAERAGRPQDAISFYRTSRAERMRLILKYDPEGHGRPSLKADQELQAEAFRMIKEKPLRHLLMTPLFLWRGAFQEFPILALAFGIALWKREYSMALFVVAALGTILFYALLTHFISRYNLPTYPIAYAVVVVFITRWVQGRSGDRSALLKTNTR